MKVSGLNSARERSASSVVGGEVVVLGGVGDGGEEGLITFEKYNSVENEWEMKPEWKMAKARHR